MVKNYRFQLTTVFMGLFILFASTVESRTTAWWRFEDGQENQVVAEAYDYGENGNGTGSYGGGSISGEPKYVMVERHWTIDGMPDAMAIQLDGVDDAITNISYKTTSWHQQFTVEAIMKWEGPVGDNNAIQTILAQGGSNGRNWLFIDNDEQKICSSQPGGNTAQLNEVNIPVGQWIYIAQSYQYPYVYLWIDTNLDDGVDPVCYNSKTYVNIDPQNVSGRVSIGSDPNKNSVSSYFHGYISELRVTTSGNGNGRELSGHMVVESIASSVHDWSCYE